MSYQNAAPQLGGEVHRSFVVGEGSGPISRLETGQIAGRIAVCQVDVDGVEMELHVAKRSLQKAAEVDVVE